MCAYIFFIWLRTRRRRKEGGKEREGSHKAQAERQSPNTSLQPKAKDS